eukprot:7724626-Lingulodinium_polyedra.AAC.1
MVRVLGVTGRVAMLFVKFVQPAALALVPLALSNTTQIAARELRETTMPLPLSMLNSRIGP